MRKRFAPVLILAVTFGISALAQTAARAAVPAAPAVPAPAASASPAPSIAVSGNEASAIGSAQDAYKAAQQAEAAPLKALADSMRSLLASPAQQALHAATVAALNSLHAALDTSAASHAVDTNLLQYNPATKAWVKGQHGGPPNRNDRPLTQ